jgi:lipoate synthase
MPMRTRPRIPSQCPPPIFEAANRPVFEKLYKSVRDSTETRNVLEFDGRNTHCKDVACPHGCQDWHEHRDTCMVCGVASRVLTRRNRLDEAHQGEEKQANRKQG